MINRHGHMSRGGFNFFFWGIVAVQFALITALATLGFLAIGEVREHGLKNVVERIWEGPSNGDFLK